MALSLPRPPRIPLDATKRESVDAWQRWFEELVRLFNSLTLGSGVSDNATYPDQGGSGRRFRLSGVRVVQGVDENGQNIEYLEGVWTEV